MPNDNLQTYRERILAALTVVFAGLLVAFGVYGMLRDDKDIINNVFGVVRYGLVLVAAWAGGSAIWKVLTVLAKDD